VKLQRKINLAKEPKKIMEKKTNLAKGPKRIPKNEDRN
jgi:hypothetical protein